VRSLCWGPKLTDRTFSNYLDTDGLMGLPSNLVGLISLHNNVAGIIILYKQLSRSKKSTE